MSRDTRLETPLNEREGQTGIFRLPFVALPPGGLLQHVVRSIRGERHQAADGVGDQRLVAQWSAPPSLRWPQVCVRLSEHVDLASTSATRTRTGGGHGGSRTLVLPLSCSWVCVFVR